jgi:hypothetical protein
MDDANKALTKQDLERLELKVQAMQAKVQLLEEKMQEMDRKIQVLEGRLEEAFRDGQARGLKALCSYPRGADASLNESEIADLLLRDHLTAIELRIN